jgi:hypothetical protein
MKHFKVFRTIALILGFSLFTFGCATSKLGSSKNHVFTLADIRISAQTVPKGILVTFSNFSNIPQDIDTLRVTFSDCGKNSEPDWRKMDRVATFKYLHDYNYNSYSENIIKQVRKTGKVVFPFVETGHKYNISAIFIDKKGFVKSMDTDCIADGGIYINKNINLALNRARTGISLSSKPEFPSNAKVEIKKLTYHIVSCTDGFLSAIGSDSTDDLFWEFEPKFKKQLKENGLTKGSYPTYVGANLNIIHNNISWILEIAKSPIFTYSL